MMHERLLATAANLIGAPLELEAELRAQTLRCRVVGGDRTVIVKASRDEPDGVAFLNDVAGLGFLRGLAPELLGVDRAAGVMVLQDLGAHGGLDALLLRGTAEAATEGLLRWAEALGGLHAATAGRRAAYEALRHGLAPIPESRMLGRLPALLQVLDGLDAPAPEAELRQALHPAPQPSDTYLHRDPCPDNVVLAPDRAVLVDFEFGAFGPVGQDASVLRLGMPTCWCAGLVPHQVLEAVEARYREAASVGLPHLAEAGGFAEALADGSAHHLAMTLLWHLAPALAEDQVWGEATMRQRIVTRLARFVPSDRWPGMRALAVSLRRTLAARWASEGLPLYPAFRR